MQGENTTPQLCKQCQDVLHTLSSLTDLHPPSPLTLSESTKFDILDVQKIDALSCGLLWAQVINDCLKSTLRLILLQPLGH